MTNNYTIKTEQDRIVELMSWLLEIDLGSQNRMIEIIREIGIKTFFEEIEYLDLEDEVKVKISNLKNILTVLEDNFLEADFPTEGEREVIEEGQRLENNVGPISKMKGGASDV